MPMLERRHTPPNYARSGSSHRTLVLTPITTVRLHAAGGAEFIWYIWREIPQPEMVRDLITLWNLNRLIAFIQSNFRFSKWGRIQRKKMRFDKYEAHSGYPPFTIQVKPVCIFQCRTRVIICKYSNATHHES